MKDVFDAIVVGAGPAGAEMAYQLALAKHRVLVLEKGPLFREKPCGGGIQTQEIVEFGGLPDSAVERTIATARVFSSKNEALEIPQFSDHCGATVKRAVFDCYLQDRAKKLGVEFLPDQPVVDYEAVNGHYRVLTRGGRESFEGRLVVYAGGAKPSALRKRLGANYTNPNRLYIAIEKWIEFEPGEIEARVGDTIEIYGGRNVIPNGYGWIFPKRNLLSVGVGTMQSTLLEQKLNLRDLLDTFVETHPIVRDKLVRGREVKFDGGLIPCEPLAKLHYPGLIFIGDAGGFGNILHGGGIWQARKSARVAAEYADRYLRTGHGALLADYEKEAKRHFWEYEGRWDSKLSRFFWQDRLLDSTVELANKGKNRLVEAFSIILNSTESHKNAYQVFEQTMLDILHRFLKTKAAPYREMLEGKLRSLGFAPPLLAPAIGHILFSDAKRFRATLAFLAYRLFDARIERALPVAAAYELLHTASLIHDDIMDNTTVRRGKETVHVKFGLPGAITAGDSLIFDAYRVLADNDWSPETTLAVLKQFSDSGVEVSAGQALDLHLTRNFDAWSVASYLEMIEKKTGALIESPLVAGGMVAGAAPDQIRRLSEIGAKLGMAFQIIDDSNDLLGSDEVMLKTLYTDLREGKCTLIMARTYELASEAERATIREVMQSPEIDAAKAQWVLALCRKFDAIAFSQRICGEIADAADRGLRELPDCAARAELIEVNDLITDWCRLCD